MKQRVCSLSRLFLAGAFATLQPAAALAECFMAPYSACIAPGDIDPATGNTYAERSAAYARMMWTDFIALNMPAAKSTGGTYLPAPDSTKGLAYNKGSYTAVWQVWPQAGDVFRPKGTAPMAFGSGHQTPGLCLRRQGDTVELTQSLVLDEYVQANRMGAVVDRNGAYVRFGIHFNRTIFDYIVHNALYSSAGQKKFDAQNPNHSKGLVQFPVGNYQKIPRDQDTGSIFLKSAWKILGKGDDPQTFFRTTAYIYDEAGGAFSDEPTVRQHCSEHEIGLVGLHIVHLTASAPQWVWATFEHVANAPLMTDFAHATPVGPYSFFDPAHCAAREGRPSCAYNFMPKQPWNPSTSGQQPTQVVRMAAPSQAAIAANADFHKRIYDGFGETVWKNYFLVDVQFPTVNGKFDSQTGRTVENPAYPDGIPQQAFLANSTMETYIPGFSHGDLTSSGVSVPSSDQMRNVTIQGSGVDPSSRQIYGLSGGTARVTSSCIDCHADASTVTGSNAHFVFSLNRAK